MSTAMPVNRKEQLMYTFLMVFLMAIIMISYNVIYHNGVSSETIEIIWLNFPLAFLVAFLCEWFIVGRFGMGLIFKILKEEDSGLKKMLVSRLVIVSGMVTLMSLYGAILMVGFSSDLPLEWISNMGMNFIFAYPLQVLIARPFIGYVFRKIFPIGSLIVTIPVEK